MRATTIIALSVLLVIMPATGAFESQIAVGMASGWRSEGGWSIDCSTDCSARVIPPCCGFHTRYLHNVSISTDAGLVAEFMFRINSTDGVSDSLVQLWFDQGWINVETTGSPGNSRLDIVGPTGRIWAGSWAGTNVWHRAVLRVEPGVSGATVKLQTASGDLVGQSPRLALGGNATQLTQVSLQAALWAGSPDTFWFDDVTITQAGAGSPAFFDDFEAGPSDDADGDRVRDSADNCPSTYNPTQADLDGDGAGDACDPDDDGDGVPDGVDNCVQSFNPAQEDFDVDGLGDACDEDDDNDGLSDADEEGYGSDPRNADTDGDGLWDGAEVYQHGTSPTSRDTDRDYYGDGTEVDCQSNPRGLTSNPATELCLSGVAPDEAPLP